MATITFRVNLETVGTPGFLQPSRTTLEGNETVTEAENMKYTRSVFIPGLLLSNYEGVGPSKSNPTLPGYLTHGSEFTVTGAQAIYLKNTYVKGEPDDILQIVSQS